MGKTTIPSRADNVVEVGTDGAWTYRKWSSGIAECWAIAEFGYAINTDVFNHTVHFPSGLFVTKPVVSVNAYRNSNNLSYTGYVNATTDYIDAYSRQSNVGSTFTGGALYVFAIGRWK